MSFLDIFLFKIMKSAFWSFIVIFILFFQNNVQTLNAQQMDNYQGQFITEELRLKIPSDFKKVWLTAEQLTWDPWLSSKEGFLGREIFWDEAKEQGLILVHWQSRELWKSISIEEVNKIQNDFDNYVKKSLDLNNNPFDLIYEGELVKQV